jgi:hypothetical protein
MLKSAIKFTAGVIKSAQLARMSYFAQIASNSMEIFGDVAVQLRIIMKLSR